MNGGKTVLKKRFKCRKLLIIFTFILLFSTSTSIYAARTLSINQVVQAKSKWCWAASSEMVGRYHNSNSTRDQWDIVKYIKGSNYPNEGGSNSEIEKAIRYASVDTVTYTTSNILSFDEHKKHIDNSNPIVVRMDWDSGGAHAVVCAGYKTSGGSNYIYIIDPIEDTTMEYYNYTSLKNGTSIQTGTGKYTKSIHKK